MALKQFVLELETTTRDALYDITERVREEVELFCKFDGPRKKRCIMVTIIGV